MKIKEVIERECCQEKDLKGVANCTTIGRIPEFVFCIHCGWWHQYKGFMDAAGARDWRYEKVPSGYIFLKTNETPNPLGK